MLMNCCLLLVSCFTIGCHAFGCVDPEGNELDWFIQLKRPGSAAYAFVTSADSGDSWTVGKDFNVSRNGPAHSTLSQALGSRLDALVAYNDEPPEESPTVDLNAESGHMKGVVAFKDNIGFWLIHSVPKYPDLPVALRYPHSGIRYGQSFICVTFDGVKQLDTVAKQLFIGQPQVYLLNATKSLLEQTEWLQKLENKTHLPKSFFNSTVDIRSRAGITFTHVAKSRRLRRDLYDSLVAPQLLSDLRAQTWEHGSVLNSNCTAKYSVVRIDSLNFSGFSSWDAKYDHSKWCVTDEHTATVCIGDMNRARSQFKRGGGIICLRHSALQRLFSSAVTKAEDCPVRLWLAVVVLAAVGVAAVVVAFCVCCTVYRQRSEYQTV